MMKTTLNNDAAIGGTRDSDEASPANNSRDEDINTPTMDFDDWSEDPFTLTKESDVFSSFTGVDDVVNASNSNANPGPLPPSSSDVVAEKEESRATVDKKSNQKNTEKTQSRKRRHSQRSSQKQTNPGTGTAGVYSKSSSSVKKKADYIPISKRKKKPKGMPKRPLSAYNLYFQAERTKIIANQQEGNGPRIGFEGLGKIIGKQWRDLSSADKKDYEKLAEKDSERYRKEMDAYHEMKAKRFEEEDRRAAEQTPVLSSIASSANSIRASSFDANFMKQHGNSIFIAHPPKSMITSISSLAPGSGSISYRPLQMEQSASPSRHVLQHNNILDALGSGSTISAAQASSRPLYLQQPTDTHRPQSTSYDGVALGPGESIAAIAPPNNNRPMPPGMEVVLSDRNGIDRKYRVQYTCYSMTRENANKYIESLLGINAIATAPVSQPLATGSNRDNSEWGV